LRFTASRLRVNPHQRSDVMDATAAVMCRSAMMTAVAAGAFVLGSLASAYAADQAVTWMRDVHVTMRGNTLEKTGGCDGCDDAGALSRQTIRSGDGYVEFRPGDPYSFWVAGLSAPNSDPRFNDIEFGFRFNGNGWADAVENGQYQPNSDTEANQGDVFRIAIVRGRVQYLKNGQLLHESQRAPRYPLAFATALGTVGARIADARIGSGAALTSNDPYGRSNDRYARSTDLDGQSFADLDRNRDGIVSYSEWTGSSREFDRLDINGDGRLSRSELGGQSTSSDYSVGTSGRQIVVDSRQQWTNTGVFAEAGDLISIDADGSIQMSTDPNDFASPAGSSRQALRAPLRSAAAGMLIARIGNSAPIAVGTHRTVRAPVSGQVLLGVNDDYLKDNNGEYHVTVDVQPR
jgi:hypothetical protein